MRKREWGESQKYREKRETNTKILNGRVTVIIHICTITVAVVHNCTLLHWPIIWAFFLLLVKMCKMMPFLYYANFATTGAVALIR